MKKLEKEQLPKAIALGVMATGLLGYAGYSWLGHGGGAAAPAAASTPHPAALKPTPGGPGPRDPVMALAPIDHENPFVPAFQATSKAPPARPAAPAAKPVAKAAKPAPPKASAAPPVMMAFRPDTFQGPAMDGDPGVALPSPAPHPLAGTRLPPAKAQAPHAAVPPPARAKPAPAKPAPAEGPKPPAVAVTGIIEGHENVAILKGPNTRGQVVRTGDRLDGGYVVREIRPDAVVLALGAHQWTVRLGAERN